ncbi:MAG: cytochrome c, partial [Alphaproteobacteria bacterium]|nr:cytochrome c [Alphaproteobacteria bacterium]
SGCGFSVWPRQTRHWLGATVLSVLLTGTALAADRTELGEGLYREHCVFCHGENGKGYASDAAPALGGQDFLVTVNDAFLTRSIAVGRPGTWMAPYAKRHGGQLDDDEIGALVAFIRGWQREASVALELSADPVVGDPAAARRPYAKLCAPCHGLRGQGQTALSLNNPEYLAAVWDNQIRWAIVHGRRGTPMPGYGATLSATEIDNLVALIRTWQR